MTRCLSLREGDLVGCGEATCGRGKVPPARRVVIAPGRLLDYEEDADRQSEAMNENETQSEWVCTLWSD